jgi:glutaredoxin
MMETTDNKKSSAGKIILLIFLLICACLGIAAFVMTLTKCKKDNFQGEFDNTNSADTDYDPLDKTYTMKQFLKDSPTNYPGYMAHGGQQAKPMGMPILTIALMPGCGFCEKIKPELTKLEQMGMKIVRLILGKDDDKIKQMGATGFPTMMINGKKHVGYKPADEIMKIAKPEGYATNAVLSGTGMESFQKTGDNIKMVICMAGWCGHCQALKKSGELEKLMQMIGKDNVMIVDEKDQDAGNMMKALGVRGFPSIMIVDMGDGSMPKKLAEHSGQRTAQSMADTFMKHKGKHHDTMMGKKKA